MGRPGRSTGNARARALSQQLHGESRNPRFDRQIVRRFTSKGEEMIGIILKGVLFVALLATMTALLFYALTRWAPLGLWWQQNRNRKAGSRMGVALPHTGSAMPMIQLPGSSEQLTASRSDHHHLVTRETAGVLLWMTGPVGRPALVCG
jgi:hypothetical protein